MRDLAKSVGRLAAVLAFASLGSSALAATSAAPAWRVVASSGRVEVLPAALESLGWQAMTRGTVVHAESQVRTGVDGRATLTANGHFIVVDPNTRLDLPAPTAPDQPTRVFQSEGSATYEVQKARRERFQVITPYLVAGVKGTRFRVAVSAAGAAVEVAEGIVEVSGLSSGGSLDVFAGEAVHMDATPDAILRPGTGEVVTEMELTELKTEETSLEGSRLFKDESLLDADRELGVLESEKLDQERLELERTLQEETEDLIKETEEDLRQALPPQPTTLPPLG